MQTFSFFWVHASRLPSQTHTDKNMKGGLWGQIHTGWNYPLLVGLAESGSQSPWQLQPPPTTAALPCPSPCWRHRLCRKHGSYRSQPAAGGGSGASVCRQFGTDDLGVFFVPQIPFSSCPGPSACFAAPFCLILAQYVSLLPGACG